MSFTLAVLIIPIYPRIETSAQEVTLIVPPGMPSVPVGLSPYDRALLEHLFYGNGGRSNTVQMAAFVETMWSMDQFQNQKAALDFFDSRVSHWSSVPGEGDLLSMARTAFTTFGVVGGVVAAGTVTPLGGIALGGAFVDVLNKGSLGFTGNLPGMTPSPTSVTNLFFSAALRKDMTGPILKRIATGSETATDEQYERALRGKGIRPVPESPTAGESLPAGAMNDVVRKMSRLFAERAAARAAGNQAALAKIEAEIQALAEQFAKFTDTLEKVAQVIAKLEQAADETSARTALRQFQQDLADLTILGSALGRLAGWSDAEQGRFSAMMQSIGMIAAGLGSQSYFTAVAGAINLVSLMFAQPSSGSDPLLTLLNNMSRLRSELHARFDGLSVQVSVLDTRVIVLARALDGRLAVIDEMLRSVRLGLEKLSDRVTRDVQLVSEQVSGVQLDMNVEELDAFNEALRVLSQPRESWPSGTSAVALGLAEERRRALRKNVNDAYLDLSGQFRHYDGNLGFANPNVSGTSRCLDRLVEDIATGVTGAEEVSTALVEALAGPSHTSSHLDVNPHCIADLGVTLMAPVPAFSLPVPARPRFEALPGSITADAVFQPRSLRTVVAPFQLWSTLRSVGGSIKRTQLLDVRESLSRSLVRDLERGIRATALWHSGVGQELIGLGYYSLASDLTADAQRLYDNDFTRALYDYGRWQEERIKAIKDGAALNTSNIYWDTPRKKLSGFPALPTSMLAPSLGIEADKLLQPWLTFYQQLARFHFEHRNLRSQWQGQVDLRSILSRYGFTPEEMPAAPLIRGSLGQIPALRHGGDIAYAQRFWTDWIRKLYLALFDDLAKTYEYLDTQYDAYLRRSGVSPNGLDAASFAFYRKYVALLAVEKLLANRTRISSGSPSTEKTKVVQPAFAGELRPFYEGLRRRTAFEVRKGQGKSPEGRQDILRLFSTLFVSFPSFALKVMPFGNSLM